MVVNDPVAGHFERPDGFFRALPHGCINLLLADTQPGGIDFKIIEPAGQFDQRGIAVLAHIRNDGGDGIVDVG